VSRALFVINPTSDGGRTGRDWPQMASEARIRGLEVAEQVTEGGRVMRRRDDQNFADARKHQR